MMTPQLQQAIRLLQLSTPELLEAVQQELAENPVLEFAGNEWGAYNGYRDHRVVERAEAAKIMTPLHHAVWNDVSLERHLQEQLSFIRDIPRAVRRIIMFMIGNLDNNGYLGSSLNEIFGRFKVELCPSGAGAKDFAEL